MEEEVVLKTVNLKKVYNPESLNAVTALHDVNIEVHKGEFLGVMGPSGSGKSTFINMISTMDYPTDGRVYYTGKKTPSIIHSIWAGCFTVGVITILNASFAYKSGAVLLAGGNTSAMKKEGGYGVTNTKVFQYLLNLTGIAAAVLPLYGFFKSSGGLAVMMVIACVGLERTISCVLLPALSRYNRKKGTASTVEAAANGFLRRDIQFTKKTVQKARAFRHGMNGAI